MTVLPLEQVIQLLHGQSAGVGRLYIRTASSVIMEMLIQYPELAQKYVISPIIRPLAQTTERQGSCEISSYATEGISIVMVGWL